MPRFLQPQTCTRGLPNSQICSLLPAVPQKVPGQYRKLTAVIPSSSFPMHYSLITLTWKAIESALLRAIFINHTHMYTNVAQELFPCDPIIGNDMGQACGTYGEEKHKVLVGKSEGMNLF